MSVGWPGPCWLHSLLYPRAWHSVGPCHHLWICGEVLRSRSHSHLFCISHSLLRLTLIKYLIWSVLQTLHNPT